MFNRPSLRELISRTLADTQSRLTAEEQLLRNDATVYARVLAGASHELHGYLDWLSRQVIYDTADAEFLERWAGMFGIERKPAEFAIGTNLACTRIIGHILQDEKLPGIHIAFGHPYCEHTGQTWKSTTHIDCVGRFFDIWLDDEQVMAKGKFLI